MGNNMFILTIDIDWAQDFIVEDTLSLLDKYGIKATIFCTHRIGVKIDKRHELGIHPNIKSIDECKKKIGELIRIYSKSIGIRNHALFSSYYLYNIYKEFGLKYESNYMMYGHNDIRPFSMANGVLQFPIYFMDDVYLRGQRAKSDKFHIRKFITSSKSGLRIFAFHPIHIYMNTCDMKDYHKFKLLTVRKDIDRLRNSKYPGIRDMFEALLYFMNKKEPKGYTLENILRKSRVKS